MREAWERDWRPKVPRSLIELPGTTRGPGLPCSLPALPLPVFLSTSTRPRVSPWYTTRPQPEKERECTPSASATSGISQSTRHSPQRSRSSSWERHAASVLPASALPSSSAAVAAPVAASSTSALTTSSMATSSAAGAPSVTAAAAAMEAADAGVLPAGKDGSSAPPAALAAAASAPEGGLAAAARLRGISTRQCHVPAALSRVHTKGGPYQFQLQVKMLLLRRWRSENVKYSMGTRCPCRSPCGGMAAATAATGRGRDCAVPGGASNHRAGALQPQTPAPHTLSASTKSGSRGVGTPASAVMTACFPTPALLSKYPGSATYTCPTGARKLWDCW